MSVGNWEEVTRIKQFEDKNLEPQHLIDETRNQFMHVFSILDLLCFGEDKTLVYFI